MKTCSSCLNELSKELFYKSKRSKDGRESKCKDCYRKAIKKIDLTCSLCKCDFKRVKSDYNPDARIFCSEGCRRSWLRRGGIGIKVEKEKFKCDFCGVCFERYKSQINGKHNIFCSRDCQYKGNSKYHSGENSFHWNHDKSVSERVTERKYEEYYLWRKSVYERDFYTCQACGDNQGGNLHAHHIYNYSEHKSLRTTLGNGITFCKDCHTAFHKEYGYKGNNERQLNEYLAKKDNCVS